MIHPPATTLSTSEQLHLRTQSVVHETIPARPHWVFYNASKPTLSKRSTRSNILSVRTVLQASGMASLMNVPITFLLVASLNRVWSLLRLAPATSRIIYILLRTPLLILEPSKLFLAFLHCYEISLAHFLLTWSSCSDSNFRVPDAGFRPHRLQATVTCRNQLVVHLHFVDIVKSSDCHGYFQLAPFRKIPGCNTLRHVNDTLNTCS